MDLYFSKNSELRFRFPVTPRAVSITTPGRGRTVMLLDAAEISLRDGLGLREVAFEALLPNRLYPFAVYDGGVFLDAGHYIRLLERLKSEREPFVFTLGSGSGGYSITVTLDSMTISEDADHGGDVTVLLRLREARDADVRVIKPVTGASPPPRPAPQIPQPRLYTVVRGDTLWAVAKRFLGSGARWPEIHALNREKVSNPNLIFAGQVLTLP
jgi:LysM repeat protein